MDYKLFLSDRIYTGVEGEEAPFAGSILTHAGKIVKINRTKSPEVLRQLSNVKYEQIDFGDLVLMPGLVDSHVHINEPGRTEWEGFATATKAAAAGGFTTIVDMPLNSIPPTTTVEHLRTKAEVAKQKTFVDLGFWGGVVPGNVSELRNMVEYGVVGFKCFLCPSGVEEFPQVFEEDVDNALTELEGTGSLLAFHAEFDASNCCGLSNDANPREYSTYLSTRPKEMEMQGVELVIRQGEKHNARVHIVHLATADAIPLIQEARTVKKVNLSVETCHHYLSLNADQIPDGHTEFKCAPPIRDAVNQNGLWQGVLNGDINLIVSDHSPSSPDVKLLLENSVERGNFLKAWGGIASVQLGLSLFWTNGQPRGVDIPMMIRLMSSAPAKLCGFDDRKGRIAEGFDADFVVWCPEEFFKLEDYLIKFKNKANPYAGKILKGVVHNTVLRGQVIYDNLDVSVGGQPKGELLLKKLF